jgi:hypothetical protein
MASRQRGNRREATVPMSKCTERIDVFIVQPSLQQFW